MFLLLSFSMLYYKSQSNALKNNITHNQPSHLGYIIVTTVAYTTHFIVVCGDISFVYKSFLKIRE